MRKIAHIVNPVVVDKKSDLFFAQPITFETMKRANKYAEGQVEIELLTAQFPEDRELVPEGFTLTPDLQHSVLDYGTFQKPRKLPLLGEILDRMHAAATDAEYLIYTNVDIAVLPQFYLAVNALIEQGHDAFVINRRTIPAHYEKIADLPLMYAEVGDKHPGFDCFVFRRDVYPQYVTGKICLGVQWIDHVFIMNLVCHANNFFVFRDLHLTFHIGDSQAWLKEKYLDYYVHNHLQAAKVVHELEQHHGPLEAIETFRRFKLGIRPAKAYLSPGKSPESQFRLMKKNIKKQREVRQARTVA